jgi:dephospho-CoA kinase
MKVYGLTGGIACGKTTVSGMLSEMGAHVIDCDALVKELQLPNSPCVRAIASTFAAEGVVDPATGELDRAKLGAVVFKDAAKRRQLARIMNGPTVRTILAALFKAWITLPFDAVVVVDAPLLYETGFLLPFCSAVLAVGCGEELQIARLKTRNDLDAEAARLRIRAQLPVAIKMERAQHVILNDGKQLPQLREDVQAAMAWMRARSTWATGWNRVMGLFSVAVTVLAVLACKLIGLV